VKTPTALAAGIASGTLPINHYGLALPEAPFGGMNDSGYGSESGLEAVEASSGDQIYTQSSPAH